MVSKIRLAGIAQQSTVNGQGLRKVFFSQGCSHHCDECFNPETWPFTNGQELEISDLVKQVVKEKYLTGVTFSGGDPFQQAEAFAALAIQLKQHNINIWSYTGYTFEELLQMSKKDKSIKQILLNIDVLIDGKYKKEQADGQLKYRGSANQRIIDVPSYFKTHKIKTLTF